jgi:hypothetical protein
MIIWIVLVLIIFFIILGPPEIQSLFGINSSKDPELESFKPILFQILSKINPESAKDIFDVQIRKSSTGTYTLDKRKIYIITEKSNGEKYNKDTILFVLLHEVAHILSPDEHHTSTFYNIEKRLHREAIKLGFLKRKNVEMDYPCCL